MIIKSLYFKFFALLLLLFSVSSCASNKVSLNYPIENAQYRDDLVSVSTTINLALQSYISGCTQTKEIDEKKFLECVEKAKKFIKDDIIFILEQDGK